MNARSARLVASVLVLSSAGFAEDFKPYPENRVRDFYSRQAEQFLSSGDAIPDILPQFPGLDGGSFGHWGQDPPERSIDRTLNDVDSGNVICSRVIHFGRTTQKGVAINFQDKNSAVSAVFDPLSLSFVDSWDGGFVTRGSGRYGVHDGARADGEQLFDFSGTRWNLPDGTTSRYLGFYRNGSNVVFSYRLGECSVLDRFWMMDGVAVRSLQFTGTLPRRTSLTVMKVAADSKSALFDDNYTEVVSNADKGQTSVGVVKTSGGPELITQGVLLNLLFAQDTSDSTIHLQFRKQPCGVSLPQLVPQNGVLPYPVKPLTMPGKGQWTEKTTVTSGKLGDESTAFAIDTLTIPYASANQFGTPMRLAGVGTMGSDRIAVSTLLGDVWVISGVDRELRTLKWQRVAAGLYQPLGLVVQNGSIILGGNDQITRLHDLNGDGEADFYECLTNDYPTTGGHDFATSLQQDQQGQLYWATASKDFGLTRFQEGGKPESLGSGLRNSNGIGVSPDGKITLATVQEGTWTPGTAIFNVADGSFHGHRGPRQGRGKFGYDLPQCFVPRGIDNSAGEICFLPRDERLGPLSGRIVGSSYGNCTHYLLTREELNGVVQGGIIPLPGEFLSGSCRLTFNPEDGFLYVAGTEGWQSYAQENGCLQRLRFIGKPKHLPTKFETRHNGLIVHFNTKIDPDSVKKESVFCQQWNYLFSEAYGSPEYSVKQEGRQGHDYVPVKSAHLLPDGQSVFVEIPQLHPVMQFHLHMRLKAADGTRFTPDAYLTIYELGKAFSDFPGYKVIAKRPWPEFPKAEEYEQDPRLVEQDKFGTNFGWVSSAKKITLNAVTGLQFEPRRLRVAPGSRVALTFHNTDPGMPHNVVVVKADQLEKIGQEAMMLASNPRAIATHYVPDDPAEICFSPILNPGDQYTVYFEAPKEQGKYRFLCTYPGHWKVMQGSLFIIPDDQPLPEPTADELSRKFVRRWKMADLANDIKSSRQRDVIRGEKVFLQAGCIKCHRIAGKGEKLGPELTDITKRLKGGKLLQQILEPSSEINKEYQTWVAVLKSGKVAAGLMVNKSDDQIALLPNPLKPTETLEIQTDDIDELTPSTKSTMPEGLLMTFTREEILDLLAYLQSAH